MRVLVIGIAKMEDNRERLCLSLLSSSGTEPRFVWRASLTKSRSLPQAGAEIDEEVKRDSNPRVLAHPVRVIFTILPNPPLKRRASRVAGCVSDTIELPHKPPFVKGRFGGNVKIVAETFRDKIKTTAFGCRFCFGAENGTRTRGCSRTPLGLYLQSSQTLL